MNRRTFFGAAAGACVAAESSAPILDTHVHFYDPARPEGVPWPAKPDTKLYRTVLPDEFHRMTAPMGVRGTIVVEASPWLEDNQWVLNLARDHPVIVGLVGHLEPGKPDFGKNLERFHKNPLLLGIRLGNNALTDAAIIPDLKLLAQANLELDAIGPPAVLASVLRIADRVPGLRIVINHMPFDGPQPELEELRHRPQVYSKVSGVLRERDGSVIGDAAYYRPGLDRLWDVFGAGRLVYGSNWPVSDKIAPYETVLKVVRDYFNAKGPQASAAYFWNNSKAAYRWNPR